MKNSLLEQNLVAPRTHAPLDRRYAERALIEHEVTYTSTEGARFTTSTGLLKDLSKTGCKIVGTTLPAVGVRVPNGCFRLVDQRQCLRRTIS